jgi:hypothetical protein
MIILRRLPWSNNLKAYMEKCLISGNNLSRMTYERIKLEIGETYAALPLGIDLSKLTSFAHGGICPLSESQDVLVKEIKHYLSDPSKIAIFEDALRRKSDPTIQRNKHNLNLVADGEAIYYYLTNSDVADDAKISRTLKQASGASAITFVGLLSEVRHSTAIEWIHAFHGAFDPVIDGIGAILVGAFDGESFLLWKRAVDKKQ